MVLPLRKTQCLCAEFVGKSRWDTFLMPRGLSFIHAADFEKVGLFGYNYSFLLYNGLLHDAFLFFAWRFGSDGPV